MRNFAKLLALPALALALPAAADSSDYVQSGATAIYDADGARMLRENDGVTLQWIGWDRRGTANVTVEADGTYMLVARQEAANGRGSMRMIGAISEIGPGYFTFRGTITIEGAPDRGRYCSENKLWHFAVTQNRRYWRLREFEWCDDLTDYIDIYM